MPALRSISHTFTFRGTGYAYDAGEHRVRRSGGHAQPCPPAPVAGPGGLGFMWLHLTNACNLRCLYCVSHGPAAEAAEVRTLTNEIARGAIALLLREWRKAPFQPPRLVLFGGEPLLNRPVLLHAMHFASELAGLDGVPLQCSVSTNATLLTRELLNHFALSGVEVQLSIDGDSHDHDSFRLHADGRGSHREAYRALALAIRTPGLKHLVRATVASIDGPLAERIRWFVAQGVRALELKFADGPTADLRGGWRADDSEIDSTVEAVLEAGRAGCTVQPYTQMADALARGWRRRSVCDAGNCAVSVAPDGRIYACHRFHGRPERLLGTVESAASEGLRLAPVAPAVERIACCRECWASAFCGGPCPATANALEPAPAFCAAKRLEAEVALRLAVASGAAIRGGTRCASS